MKNRFALALVATAVLAVAVVAAGCSGDDENASENTTTTGSAASAKRFPELRVVYDKGFDYVDPALSYTVQGWSAGWNVYLSLLGYKHAAGPEGATIVPVLAEDLPEVSSDGLTYKLKLREGLKYSNGQPVRASDFKYAIERLFRITSPGIGFFTNIVGAEKYAALSPAQMRTAHIEGITTDDEARTIEIELVEPRGDFQNILALSFTAPVPPGTRATEQYTLPSTGPYRVARYRPGRALVLVRNRYFVPTPNVPRTNADKITGIFRNDPSRALDLVLQGQADYDYVPFPLERLREVRRDHAPQMRLFTPANTYYFFMNTRRPPFDKKEVRQAINYAIDRKKMARLYRGLATPTENVLPPNYPSYRRHSLYPHDLAKARQLVEEAGARGARVTVWGSTRDNSRPQVRYLTRVLNSLGFRADARIVEARIYWSTIGSAATRAQIGFALWFQDYPHPLDWFDVLLNGEHITPRNNQNYSNADVDSINDEIDDLKREPELSDDVNQKWADLDRDVMEEALWAPFVNRRFIDLFSEDVDLEGRCYVNHVLFQIDLGRICKK